MSDELEELKLKAARIVLEREELALAREREQMQRQERRQAVFETAVQETTAVGKVATKTGKAILGYLGRLALMLLLWLFGCLAVAVYLYFEKVPSGVRVDFGYILGYVAAASSYYAPWMCLIAAFFRLDLEQASPVLVFCGGLIVAIHQIGSPAVFPVAQDFKEFISPSLLAYAQAPGLTKEERFRRYGQYFQHSDCGKSGTNQLNDAAYRLELILIEREYPYLNPDSQQFRPDLEGRVESRMQDYIHGGNTIACKSLRLAADEVLRWR